MDAADDILAFILAHISDDHFAAFAGEKDGGGFTDAAGGAGYDADFVFETHRKLLI
jgi:hypothetical protein